MHLKTIWNIKLIRQYINKERIKNDKLKNYGCIVEPPPPPTPPLLRTLVLFALSICTPFKGLPRALLVFCAFCYNLLLLLIRLLWRI